MPTWGEILVELQTTPPVGRASPFDIVRRKYLNQLRAHTGRNVVLYATKWTQGGGDPMLTMINAGDVQGFMEVMHGLDPAEGLDIVLHSPGGSAEATESIVQYIRSKFNDVRVIVPHAAMSAATMLACSANRVVMGKGFRGGPPKGGTVDNLTPEESLRRARIKAEAVYWNRVKKARWHFPTYAEMVAKDEAGNPIEYAPMHHAWADHVGYCWSRRLHAMILAPFGSGKCQPAGSPVQMADGSVVAIDQLDGLHASVLAFDESRGTYEPAWGRAFKNGARRVLRVHLRSGRSVDATEEHPFFCVSGWVRAGDLAVGRHVAVANNLPSMGHRSLPQGAAALLGYFIGDGSATGENAAVTNGDPGVVSDIERCGALLGFGARRKVSGRGVAVVAFSGGVRPWLRQHGVYGHGSRDKVTPGQIFTAPAPQVAEYLGAYLACDGHVSEHGVEIYSVNRGLLDDAQALFARLGVVSRVRAKRGQYLGKPHASWRLSISRKSWPKLRALPVAGTKGARIAALGRGARLGNGDLVPIEYRSLLIRTAHWHKVNTGVSLDQSAHRGYVQRGTEREVVVRAAAAEGNERLLLATSPALLWDEVVAVDDLGEKPTWGMQVDRLHTYVTGGGVIVHNSSGFLVPLATYLVGRDVQVRIKFVSNGDDFAGQRVQGAQQIMESHEYADIFPHVVKGRRWNTREAFVRRKGASLDPTLHARGVETKGIGGRAEYVFFDDVCDEINSAEQRQRAKIKQRVKRTWMSRLDPQKGLAAWIATPWHADDATHEMMQMEGWCTLIQRVSPQLDCFTQEVIGAGADYPGIVVAA